MATLLSVRSFAVASAVPLGRIPSISRTDPSETIFKAALRAVLLAAAFMVDLPSGLCRDFQHRIHLIRKNRYSSNADKVANKSHSTLFSVSRRQITPNKLPPTIEIAAISNMARERVMPEVYRPSRHSVSRTPNVKASRKPYEKNAPENEPPACAVVFRMAV